jgi:hypothetical protein
MQAGRVTVAETIVERFTREIRTQWDRSPVWLPGTDVRVGDVGSIDGSSWKNAGDVSQYGVKPVTRYDQSRTAMEHISTHGVGIELASKAQGSTPIAKARGSFLARFSESGAFIFRAEGTRGNQLRNVRQVQRAILRAWLKGEWDPDLGFVTEVVQAQSGIILIAKSKGGSASVQISASGKRTPPGKAAGSVSFAVSGSSSLQTNFVSNEPFAALYRVAQLSARDLAGALSGRDRLLVAKQLERGAAVRFRENSAFGLSTSLTPRAMFIRAR